LKSGKIADLLTRTEKLVVSCNKIEEKSGFLLDKTAIMMLASMIISIISRYIVDQNTIDAISTEIGEAITKQNNNQEIAK
jgi:hypothetical protein